MDLCSIIFKVYLTFQKNPSTRIIIKTRQFVVRFKFIKAAPVSILLKQEFTYIISNSILQEKIFTYQTEETLKVFTLQQNSALFLRLRFY